MEAFYFEGNHAFDFSGAKICNVLSIDFTYSLFASDPEPLITKFAIFE